MTTLTGFEKDIQNAIARCIAGFTNNDKVLAYVMGSEDNDVISIGNRGEMRNKLYFNRKSETTYCFNVGIMPACDLLDRVILDAANLAYGIGFDLIFDTKTKVIKITIYDKTELTADQVKRVLPDGFDVSCLETLVEKWIPHLKNMAVAS